MALVLGLSQRRSETVVRVPIASSVWEIKAGHHLTYHKGEGMHVKDMTDLIETQPPGSDRHFIFFDVKTSRDRVPFAPLDNVLLDFRHSPAIEDLMSKLSRMHFTGSTHVTNRSIALRMGWLGGSARLPPIP